MVFEQAKRGSLAENFHETTYRASLQLLVVVAKPKAQNGKTFGSSAILVLLAQLAKRLKNTLYPFFKSESL